MDIAWIGHAAFRLRGREAALVTDPCPSSTGFRLGRPQADIVTISTPDPAHIWFQGVAGDPVRLDAPGEYEIKNILVTGVACGGRNGEPPNTCFVLTIDDVIVAHLGDLRHEPDAAAMDELSRAQILLVPVGGRGHMDASRAARVVAALEPAIAIPMLYAVPEATVDLDGIEPFLKAMGTSAPGTLENHINVTAGGLPERPMVQVLTPRGD